MNLINIFENILDEYRRNKLERLYGTGNTLRKNDTGLPVNIWIDDMAWKKKSHWKRIIKFQPDKDDKADTRTFIPMSIEDNPQIKERNPKLFINSGEIEQIKQFIIINKDLLLKYSIQEITITEFLEQMQKTDEVFDDAKKEPSSLQEMATLRKYSSQLSSNLYLDDSMSYKRSSHPNQKRIKFQTDNSDKAITDNFLEMRFDGEINSLNSPASLNLLKLSSEEVNGIRQFVFNNTEALETLADMNIEIEDFKRIMIKGTTSATPDQKNQFLLNLQQAKDDFKIRNI
jgi:hypothetical protein